MLIKLILTHDQKLNSVENISISEAVLYLFMPCLLLISYIHDISQIQSLVTGRKWEPIRINKSAFRGKLNFVAKW
jgi:hypothetical protein